MPAPTRRMYPARDKSTWLALVASAGASFIVEMRAREKSIRVRARLAHPPFSRSRGGGWPRSSWARERSRFMAHAPASDRRYTVGAMTQPTSMRLRPPSRTFFVLNAALTIAVMTFLVWVVYFHPPRATSARSVSPTLPAINAGLNALSALLLGAALGAVKKRRYRLHAGL